jgi:putative sterol carrier protein
VSSDPRTLGEYIAALVDVVDGADAYASARMRAAAGSRRARIGLDDESVIVAFDGGRLVVTADVEDARVDGTGHTESATVSDIIRGRLEATAAILDGRVQIKGSPGPVSAILQVIEILLDTSSRAPALQQLAQEFLATRTVGDSWRPPKPTAWHPCELAPDEQQALIRLDLIADASRIDP